MKNFFLLFLFFILFGAFNGTAEASHTNFKLIQSDSTTVKIKKIRQGVWVHTSYHNYQGVLVPSNGLIVKQKDRLVLFDTPWGIESTKKLLKIIKQKIGLPIRYAIATHYHEDRTAGVDYLESRGVIVYTHPLTPELAKKAGNPVPDHVLKKISEPGSAVKLGSIEIFYPGPGHTVDNIVAWLPDKKVLYGGCLMRNMKANTLGNTADANLKSWPRAVKRLKKRYQNIQIVVPGHGKIGGAELLGHTLKLFKTND